MPEDGRRFEHLDHERAAPGRQVVLRAHAREDAVNEADPRAVRGHETADLCQQRNQRHHPQVRGLAGHIRAGQEHDLAVGGIEPAIVGDEAGRGGEAGAILSQRPLQRRFHHRVPAGDNLQFATLVECGSHIAVLYGEVGKAEEHVELRQGIRTALEPPVVAGDLFEDAGVKIALQLGNAFLRREDARFVFLEFGCDVAFALRERLATDVFRRHISPVGVADLNVVAEDLVVAHPERLDAGAPTLHTFERRYPLARRSGAGDQLV